MLLPTVRCTLMLRAGSIVPVVTIEGFGALELSPLPPLESLAFAAQILAAHGANGEAQARTLVARAEAERVQAQVIADAARSDAEKAETVNAMALIERRIRNGDEAELARIAAILAPPDGALTPTDGAP